MKFERNIKSDYYMFKLDYNHKVLEEALGIVREYILDNDLLVVGGMAIDLALKENDDGIYSEYEIPDYDVISPENVKHANAVGVFLCEKGYQNVAVIPAVHMTTMRVQIAGYTVFDATFIPFSVYKNIPILQAGAYSIVHPTYQMIDQLVSLAMLWQITGPDFNIFNRLEKDQKRYALLCKYYSMNDYSHKYKPKQSIAVKVPQTVTTGPGKTIDIDFVWHGQIAYSLYYKMFKELNHSVDDIFALEEYGYIDSYELLVQKARGTTDNFKKGFSTICPDQYTQGNITYHVLNNFTVNNIGGIWIASPYYIMAYFLYNSFQQDSPKWANLYQGIKKMIERSEEIRSLSLFSVGIEYWKDESYEYYIDNYVSFLDTNSGLTDTPPRNYLSVSDCIIKKQFDAKTSKFYNIP